jgi:hypothetical protein
MFRFSAMSESENELLASALAYAGHGYPVFPISPGRKKPPITEHGLLDATTDAKQIEQWWHYHPSANIGIATHGLLIVDIDRSDNPWLSDQPERLVELASGAVSLTAGGGKHFVFRQPANKHWRNTTSQLALRVDTRADGGYIVAPPSRIEGGGAYRWVPGLELECPPERLPEPPGWLVDLLDRLHGHEKPVSVIAGNENAIPETQRNATLASLAGVMRRHGMSQPEILAALQQVNRDRCLPALEMVEVERISRSIARYEPDQISVAMIEHHWEQMRDISKAQLTPVSLGGLTTRYPALREPVIHGLLRQGETMNVIASSKTGKSWLVTDLALAIATGRPWLDTFECVPGPVLIIDNELHGETSANRIPKVAAARQINLAEIAERVFVQNLRGHLMDIVSLGPYFRALESGRFKVIILDAMYRFMPMDTDENDNGSMANIYNQLDSYADYLRCSFVLIHHTSKGNQSGKSLTDVGAGAGSQSRATDTHLILRPHEETDAVVLEAAVRSWPPVMARCLRWAYPVWLPADDLDPAMLRSERPRRPCKERELEWTIERFVTAFVGDEPKLVDAILVEANESGINDFKVKVLLRKAEALSRVHRWDMGRGRLGYATQAPPVESEPADEEAPVTSRRAQVESMLQTSPEYTSAKIAEICGVSKRYVNRIRTVMGGNRVGTNEEQGGNWVGTKVGTD